MSLDVYLRREETQPCEGCGRECTKEVTLFSYNITHNLRRMAGEAGIYEALWRPEEIGAKLGSDLVPLLKAGLAKLKEDRVSFERFNPTNGWGNYDGLVRFVEEYLGACKAWPKAKVSVSR